MVYSEFKQKDSIRWLVGIHSRNEYSLYSDANIDMERSRWIHWVNVGDERDETKWEKGDGSLVNL